MASISVVDMHQRYKRVQSLQRKIKRQIPMISAMQHLKSGCTANMNEFAPI